MIDKFTRNWIIVLAAFFAFMCWLLLSGCYTEKIAVKQVAKAGWQHPNVVADYCALKYPIKTITEYKEGETILNHDTVSVDCDTVKGKVNVVTNTIERKVYIPCPPSSARVDTFFKESESTAKTDKLTIENNALKTDKTVLEGEVAFWKKWAIWATVVALLMIIWNIL